MEIIMGKTYRDIVSGFEGICTGVVEWMPNAPLTIRMYPGRDTGINPMMTPAIATTMKRIDIGLRAVTLLNGKPAIPARTVTVISS